MSADRITRPMTMTTNQYAVSKRAIAALIGLILLLGAPTRLEAQSYTLAPPPFLYVWATSGAIVPNGCVWTYAAGSTTPIATYSDSSGTPNANPIIADNYGRFVAYLLPGTNYKFTYEATPCSFSGHGATIKTQDSIQGSPASSANVDVTGTAGESISAGQCVYLSDGSGSKTVGQWYKCDSTNTYSSTLPVVGFAPSSISSATTGTIRIAGYLTGLSSLTVGSSYFVTTGGGITATAPANRRYVGQADTTTTLIVAPDPALMTALASGTASSATFLRGDQTWAPPLTNGTVNGRLTLTSGTCETTSDVTAAPTVYFTPCDGNVIALYDGSATWTPRTFAELPITLSGLVNAQAYDVFAYDNGGTVAVETAEWANATVTMTIAAPGVVTWTGHGMTTGQSITFTTTGTLPTGVTANTQYWITTVDANTFKLSTSLDNVAAGTFITTSATQSGTHTGHQPQARQTALTLQNGVWVKSGATTRRYLGAFLTTSTSTTEDSLLKRFLSNWYNRARRPLLVKHSGTTYTYTTDTYRRANADAANQSAVFIGLQKNVIALDLNVIARNDTTDSALTRVAFGEDSTNTAMSNQTITYCTSAFVAAQGNNCVTSAHFSKAPTLGYHQYVSLERSSATGTSRWYGNNADASAQQSGQTGWVEN